VEPAAGHELLKEVLAARKLKEIRFIVVCGPCRTGGSSPKLRRFAPDWPRYRWVL